MLTPLMEVEAEMNRIHDACDETERALTNIDDGEVWRLALGFIDSASRRVYRTRKLMLDEAIKRAQKVELK